MSKENRSAIICAAGGNVVDLARKVLKELSCNLIEVLPDSSECIDQLRLNLESILILEWSDPSSDALKVLSAMQSQHPAAIRPIFLFSRSSENDLRGTAIEYGVLQVHSGPLSKDILQDRLNTLLGSQVYNEEIRETFSACAANRLSGDISGEVELLESLFLRYPDDEVVAAEIAEAYFQKDEAARSMEIVEKFIHKKESSPRLLNLHGRCLLKMGRWEEATISLQQADLINPYNIDRLLGLGEAYNQLDNPTRGKRYADRALALDPESMEAKKVLTQSLLQLGDINPALIFLKQIGDPMEMASVFNAAAVVLIRNSRKENGLSLYRLACETLGAGNVLALAKLAFNMGLAYFRSKEYPKSMYFITLSHMLNDQYPKANAAIKVLERLVPEAARHPIPDDVFAALVDQAIGSDQDDLLGEDMSIKDAMADYDMDF